jgi:glutathione S-transferase
MTYVLHYAPDNASLIIRLALEELGLPYRTQLVARAARAQDSASYRALNPAGRIPVLETDEGPLFETAAILVWLGGRHPGFLPVAQLPWVMMLSNDVQTPLRFAFYPERFAPGAEAALKEAMRGQILRSLGLLEQARVFGEVGALECYLGPLLRWCALYPVDGSGWFDLSAFPRLRAIAEMMEERASVRAAIAAEGLGARPFTGPVLAEPPEGSAV